MGNIVRVRNELREFVDGLGEGVARRLFELLVERGDVFDEVDVRQGMFLGYYFDSGGKVSVACKKAGVGYATYRKWLGDPAFVGRMKFVEGEWLGEMFGVCMGKAMGGDNDMLKFLMGALAPEKYCAKYRSERLKVEEGAKIFREGLREIKEEEAKKIIDVDPAGQYQQ
jgi:hypothetical protein